MLINDIMNCEKQLQAKIPDIYNGLDEVRKSVLLNMCFNLGINGLLGLRIRWRLSKPETGNGLPTICLCLSGRSRLAAERLSYPN